MELRAELKGRQLMLLFLGRAVSLSFAHRLHSCRSPSPARPVLLGSVLIQLGRITGVTHGAVFGTATSQHTGTMPERRPFVRLPTDVYPVNYGLSLKPDLIDFTFEGKLEASVEVKRSRRLNTQGGGLSVCAWRGFSYVIPPASVTSR